MTNNPDAIVLFSGGLDSILAAKLLLAQGLKVLCLHLTSPFFGNVSKVEHWSREYGLEIRAIDVSRDFAAMLAKGPEHGFGKTLNPCVDCKIMQFSQAAKIMRDTGASFIATGEVPGQRPMSQRGDMLNHIPRKAGLSGQVLRPLSARLLEPIGAEIDGLVDRQALLGLSGRGRNGQLELAKRFELREIPTPAGGCKLTEKENSRRYWQILKNFAMAQTADGTYSYEKLAGQLHAANLGRFFRKYDGIKPRLLHIGRNAADNAALMEAARPGDATLKTCAYPGPTALCEGGSAWPLETLREAASFLAAYSPHAIASGQPVTVSCRPGQQLKNIVPQKPGPEWEIPDWETVRGEIRAFIKESRGKN